jgi:hypothetical protein
MSMLTNYVATDEAGSTYRIHRITVQEAPARLVADDGREVRIVRKGVYDIVGEAVVVRVTCDDPNAP